MPKKTKPKKQVHAKTHIFVVVSVVIVGLVVLAVGVRAYRINQQRAAFAKADAVAAATIEEISDQLGEPKYLDRTSVCYMRAPEEFSNDQLYCNTVFKVYYQISPGKEDDAVSLASDTIGRNYGVALEKETFANDSGILVYSGSFKKLEIIGGLGCSFSVQFPEENGGNYYLPMREFSEKNIMEVSADCDTQSITPYYKMVEG